MLTTAIALGVAGATMQSLSYIFSRLYVTHRHKGIARLLILAHAIMAAISLAALPWLWSDDVPALSTYVRPLLASTVFYLTAQVALFVALHRSDASRIAPLLTLKVVVLALIGWTFLGDSLAGIQWFAIGVSVFAGLLLSYTGGRLPWQSVLAAAGACVFYALSDINVKALIGALSQLGTFRATLLSVFLIYTTCGLVGLAAIPWVGAGSLKDLVYAGPFAICWIVAMVFLFGCFATGGVVFAGIIQATRGMLSITIGAMLAALGMERIEQKASRSVFVRRLFAAGLMVGAIALYSMGSR